MSLPDDYTPYVTSARRWRWLTYFYASREGTDSGNGRAAVFQSLRLNTWSRPLPSDLPSRTLLLNAGVLAVEEVIGASVAELRLYGLGTTQAEALITHIEASTEITMPNIFQAGPRIGETYEGDAIILAASALVTAGAAGDSYELGDKGTMQLVLDVTTLASSGVLRVQVETRASSSDTWRPIGSFSPITAVGSEYRTIAGCDRYVRIYFGLTGASATFSVTGTAI